MKIYFVPLLCMGFAISTLGKVSQTSKTIIKEADEGDFLPKQKFLLEIVYRIGHPLQFDEWIRYGNELIIDKNHYINFDTWMEKYYESYQSSTLLDRGEFFGALVKTHRTQATALYKFFYNAIDWDTFMRNVCWARINANEGMFVYALTLAVMHRADLAGLRLPSIQEIIPEYFFHEKFIFRVAKFNLDNWNRSSSIENGEKYLFVKEWKMWQWWRLMGFEEKFHIENFKDINRLKIFWMPLDYTRDIEVYNDFSKLSYFAEDVAWNCNWYYMNLQYSGDPELWFNFLQRIMARNYMERLSNGFGETDKFSWDRTIRDGYDSQLYCYNGIGFSYRRNNWKVASCGGGLNGRIANLERRLANILDLGYFQLTNGQMILFREPNSIQYLSEILQSALDESDRDHDFLTHYQMLAAMYFGDVDEDDIDVFPNVFMNYETMVRDPMFYIFYKRILQILFRFENHLQPYRREELLFNGVRIDNVAVSKLLTFFELVDFDVSTLLNDEMHFVDGQLQWNVMLKGRQIHLNHKPFHFDLTIFSDKNQKATVRVFLGPKFDEFGRIISLAGNRENFMKFDEFNIDLIQGKNIIKRNSIDIINAKDHFSYTEFYRNVSESAHLQLITFDNSHLPANLMLPRGWVKGMPVQLFVMITPILSPIDNLSYNYPFDRIVKENSFIVPNIYFKNLKIYHQDILEKYKSFSFE